MSNDSGSKNTTRLFQNAKIGKNQWWRHLLTLVVTAIGFLIGQSFLIAYLYFRKAKLALSDSEFETILAEVDFQALQPNSNLLLVAIMGQFITAFLAFWLMIRFVHGRSLLTVLTGRLKIDFSRFAWGFFVWLTLASGLVPYPASIDGFF